MNGTSVDMAAVHWLWLHIASGEFSCDAYTSHMPSVTLQGVDQDVGASLAMLLGSKNMSTDQIDAVGGERGDRRRRQAVEHQKAPVGGREIILKGVKLTKRFLSLRNFQ